MWIRRPRSISELAALVALAALAPREASADPPGAVAPAAPSRAMFAGIALDRLAIPGLHLRTRDDHTLDRGGIVMSFDDDQGRVRAVVRVAVAADASAARAFAERFLRGVSGAVESSAIEEWAYADKAEALLVAARGNVAYAVEIVGAGPRASTIAEVVKRAFVTGAPSFPRATIILAPTIDLGGAPVKIAVPAGATYRLRTARVRRLRGAVARGRDGASFRCGANRGDGHRRRRPRPRHGGDGPRDRAVTAVGVTKRATPRGSRAR
jgi:hypothetical protein